MINISRKKIGDILYNDMMWLCQSIRNKCDNHREQLNMLSYDKYFEESLQILKEIERADKSANKPWWKEPDYKASNYNKLYQEWEESEP